MGNPIDLELQPMTQSEKTFFRSMGERIASLRKDANLSQQQLADTMQVSQQTIASWEVGRRRVPVSLLPALARALGTTVEALIGEKAPPAKRGPTPKLQQQMQRLSALPKPKQRAVMEVLEAMLAQAGRT
jgi:transcriptional regulator with XRE-family HTH domain